MRVMGNRFHRGDVPGRGVRKEKGTKHRNLHSPGPGPGEDMRDPAKSSEPCGPDTATDSRGVGCDIVRRNYLNCGPDSQLTSE